MGSHQQDQHTPKEFLVVSGSRGHDWEGEHEDVEMLRECGLQKKTEDKLAPDAVWPKGVEGWLWGPDAQL